MARGMLAAGLGCFAQTTKERDKAGMELEERNWNGNWNWHGRVETAIPDDGESATAQPPQKTAVGRQGKVQVDSPETR